MSENDEDNGPAILGVAIATTVVAALCVFLRLYIRIWLISSFSWDDGLMAVALVLSIAGTVFNGFSVSSGAGKHIRDLSNPLTQVPDVIKWNTAYQMDNVICVNLIKLSILLFVLRIPNSKTTAYLIYFVMFSMSIVNMVAVGAIASQCRPLEKLWNPTMPGECFYEGELARFGYGQGVVNVLTDFFCTLTPILILWNVKIKRRMKFAICGLMSIGLVATASQIVRVVALNSLSAEDYTYQITTIVISAILDQNLGIIAACIPTFPPLFRARASTLQSPRSRSAGKGVSTSTSHPQSIDRATDAITSPEAGYSRLQSIHTARDSAARYSGESGYPLHPLPTIE